MSQNVYHFNPETGRTGKCSATVKGCAFAVNGETPEHYNTAEEAQSAYESQMSSHTLSNTISKIQNDDFKNLTEEQESSQKQAFHQAKDLFKDIGASLDSENEQNISEEERLLNEKDDAEFSARLDSLIEENRSYLNLDELKYSDYLHERYDEKESLISDYKDIQTEYEFFYSADYQKEKDREILENRLENIDKILVSVNESNEENLGFYSDSDVKEYIREKNLTLQQKFSLDSQELKHLDEENRELEKDMNIEMSKKQELMTKNLNRSLELEKEIEQGKTEYNLSLLLRSEGYDEEKDPTSFLKEYVKRLKS